MLPIKTQMSLFAWWRHQMETFSALLAICAGNSPVPGEFPAQRPVTRSFDVFFDLRLNKRLSKQSWGWWFETLSRPLWRHRNGLCFVVVITWRITHNCQGYLTDIGTVIWLPHSRWNKAGGYVWKQLITTPSQTHPRVKMKSIIRWYDYLIVTLIRQRNCWSNCHYLIFMVIANSGMGVSQSDNW